MRQARYIAALLTLSGACAGASAQAQAPLQPEGLRPMATDHGAGLPDAGQRSTELFGDRRVFDAPIAAPDHPPLDEIPPMPMDGDADAAPPPGQQWVDFAGGVTIFDAETGEMINVPARIPSGQAGAESAEGDYWGVAPHDPLQELTRGFGNMTPAGSLGTWPRSGNVKLAMRFTDQNGNTRWFSCSGTMADAGVVLTAAHCIYARNPNGINIFDWAEIVYIYPAWDGNGGIFGPATDAEFENFGMAYGTSYIAGTDYINNGNWDRDAGLVRITRGGSRNVGMLTGWFAWAWGFDCSTIQSRTYHNFSYPAENCGGGLHTGTTMYYWNGTVDSCPGNQMQLDTGGNCLDTVWGGMSGSGMYYVEGDSRYVHGVCSTSNRDDVGRYCKLWEQFTIDMVDFENNTRSNSQDWEPLMFRARGSTTVRAGTAMNDSCDVAMINATNANPGAQDYRLRVYLSDNNNISTSDTLLATWDWNNRDFGAMANVNFVVPAPFIPIDTPPGQYWIGVIADAGIPGTDANDDTDTWDAQRITVTLGLPASASAPSPAHNATGQSIASDLDWGNAARATSYRVHFGTSSNPPFVGTAFSSSWTLPNLAYDTRYYWRIDTVNSAGTTTGPLWSFRTDVEPRPDLSAEVADAPSASYYRGQNVPIFHRTRNIGNASSTGTTVEFRLSTNTAITTLDPLMDTRNFAGLGVNGVLQTTTSVQIPPDTAPGDYYVGIIVSEPGDDEPNFGNNDIADLNTITVRACAPDLASPWGVLNFFDLSTYLNRYNAQDPSADLAAPFGAFNFFDISAYLSSFNAGCP
jgi:V8-like Glu-specific endopeptidase